MTSCPHPAEGEGLAWQLAGEGRLGDVPSCPQPPLAPWAQGQGTNCSAVMPGWPPQVQCDAFRFCGSCEGWARPVWTKHPRGCRGSLHWPEQGARRPRTYAPRAPCLGTHRVRGGFFPLDAAGTPVAEYCLYQFFYKGEAQRWALTCPRLPRGREGRAGPRTTVG